MNNSSSERLLVLGGYPSRNISRSRAFYNNPNTFIINTTESQNTNTFRNRYSVVDFTNTDQLRKYSQDNPNRFKQIAFDWSSFKFFNHPRSENTLNQRLQLLLNMLSDNGVLYIETPEGESFTPGQRITESESRIKQLQNTLNQLGYSGVIQQLNELPENIREIYSTLVNGPNFQVMEVRKTGVPAASAVLAPFGPNGPAGPSDLSGVPMPVGQGGKRKTRNRKNKKRKSLKRR
jgi:hypothetical protein